MPTMPTHAAVVAAPGFSLGIHCNDDEITGIDFLEPRAETPAKSLLTKEAVRQLRAYLKNARFDFSLPPDGIAAMPAQTRRW